MINMRTVLIRSLAAGCVLALGSAVALADLSTPVSSTFDTDLDGWLETTSGEVSWSDSGGHPDGYAHFHEHGDTATNLIAPAKFLGDWSGLEDVGSLSFDFRVFRTGAYHSRNRHLAEISGPGGRAQWIGPTVAEQPTDWVSFATPLTETAWTLQSGSWDALLADVTQMWIAMDLYVNKDPFHDGEITGLDNVRLIPEPGSIVLAVLGIGLVTRRRP